MKKLEIPKTLKPILIFSDLHLGTLKHDLTVEKIYKVIKQIDPCVVVFNGDTFNFPCRKQARATLNVLRDLNTSCIAMYFVNGNHDPLFPDNQLLVSFEGKKILFEHGHAYGTQPQFLDHIGTFLNETIIKKFKVDIQEWLRRVTAKDYIIDGSARKMVRHLYEERQKIVDKYSNQTDYQCIVTGHTHYKEVTFLPNHVLYINSGHWANCTVIHPNLAVKQLDLQQVLGMIR